MKLTKIFTEHPHLAGETYFEHMRVALAFARQTFGASMASLIHAFLPNLHPTTASDRIRCLGKCLELGNRDAITLVKAVVDTEPAG